MKNKKESSKEIDNYLKIEIKNKNNIKIYF